ncbi:MAG: phosphopantetheine-binding protein [Bacteroidota bacterium]|nr:phosphopantetheine-binding protein [Bacteroidota bacterium]
MKKEDMLQEITNIFKDVLDVEDILITNETTSDDIEEWDSLTHIQLIVAIEKHFKVKFSSMEISNWKNVGEMTLSIHKKIESTNQDDIIDKSPIKVNAKSSAQSIIDSNLPSYLRNYISDFPDIKHGKNCFFSEGVSVKNLEIGDQVWFNKYATVYSSHEKIVIGSNCYIGPYVWIEGHAGLELGNSVHIAGPGTSIYTHSGIKMALNGEHLGNPGYKPDIKSLDFRAPIRIGNNVWIGPNCSISPGVVIQDYVVVMPNTIVKSGIIESYSTVHGDGVVEKKSDFVKSFLIDNNHK